MTFLDAMGLKWICYDDRVSNFLIAELMVLEKRIDWSSFENRKKSKKSLKVFHSVLIIDYAFTLFDWL